MEREPPGLTREEAMRLVLAMPLYFEPGEAYDYTNTGFTLLGMIAERITGQGYAELVQERIAGPLGHEGHPMGADTFRRMILPKFYTSDARAAAVDDAYFAGEGGIVSTLDDMLIYGARPWIAGSCCPQHRGLMAFTMHGDPALAHREQPPNYSPYGYGFQLGNWPVESSDESVQLVGHGGFGYGSSCWLYCEQHGDGVLIYWNNMSLNPYVPALFSAFVSETR